MALYSFLSFINKSYLTFLRFFMVISLPLSYKTFSDLITVISLDVAQVCKYGALGNSILIRN